MAMQISGAKVTGEFRGYYEVPGKEGKNYLYGQIIQTDKQGKEIMLEFKAKDEEVFNTMKKGDKVEVSLNIREMDYQGRKYVIVESA